MPSRKPSKAGKKKSAAQKKASTKGRAVTQADLDEMRRQVREITAAAAKIVEAADRMSGTAPGRAGLRSLSSRSTGVTRALGCLDLLIASQIVQDAAGGPHNIDKTLLEIGFINDNQRRVFQEDVFNGVLDAGCEINRGDIPNGAGTSLREVRTAIRAAAH